MPKSKKSFKSVLCEGCLTSGRQLSPIKEYLRLYKKLMEDVLCDQTMHKKVPQMCWECRSILRTVQKFQQRAKEAYESLVIGTDSIDKTTNVQLSTLNQYPSNQNIKMPDDERKTSEEDKTKGQNVKSNNEEISEEKEVKCEFGYAVDGIKEENEYDDIKMESYVEIEGLTEPVYSQPRGDIKEEINDVELRNRIKFERAKVSRKAKYKVIRKMDYQSFTKLCSAVKIDDSERQRCMEDVRKSEEYLSANFKCDKCIVGYSKRQKYEKHLMIYHSESNAFVCELCKARFSSKVTLMKHVKGHEYKYVCSLCGHERLNKRSVFAHIAEAHRIAYECRECGLRFHDKYKDFYKHYNTMHRRVVCDYCGFRGTSKQRLINHIRVNHCENICKYCNKRYAVYHSMTRHIALRHTKEVSEESYCVECNMQFDNIMLYTRHLKTSVKHKPKIVFPCSECSNVYAKKTAMMNHYKYIHLQKTNYYCDKCSRYFLNGFRLRTHIATYHNNIQAPKNKICSYCGRGFVTNRILDNHIRTHTGERPFACSHCTATFAQKSALVTHARAIHKVMMRYANKE